MLVGIVVNIDNQIFQYPCLVRFKTDIQRLLIDMMFLVYYAVLANIAIFTWKFAWTQKRARAFSIFQPIL